MKKLIFICCIIVYAFLLNAQTTKPPYNLNYDVDIKGAFNLGIQSALPTVGLKVGTMVIYRDTLRQWTGLSWLTMGKGSGSSGVADSTYEQITLGNGYYKTIMVPGSISSNGTLSIQGHNTSNGGSIDLSDENITISSGENPMIFNAEGSLWMIHNGNWSNETDTLSTRAYVRSVVSTGSSGNVFNNLTVNDTLKMGSLNLIDYYYDEGDPYYATDLNFFNHLTDFGDTIRMMSSGIQGRQAGSPLYEILSGKAENRPGGHVFRDGGTLSLSESGSYLTTYHNFRTKTLGLTPEGNLLFSNHSGDTILITDSLGNVRIPATANFYKGNTPINGGGGTETDPVFSASPSYGITTNNINDWNAALPRLDTLEQALSDVIDIINDTIRITNLVYTKAQVDSITATLLDSINAIEGGGVSMDYDTIDYLNNRIDSLVIVVAAQQQTLTEQQSTLNNILAYLESQGLDDFEAPVFVSAKVGPSTPNSVRIAMDTSDIRQDSIPDDEDFYLTANGSEVDVTTVVISNDSIFLTLARNIVYGEVLLLDYTRANDGLQDSTGNYTVNWNNYAVTNNIAQVSATAQNLIIESEQIDLWNIYQSWAVETVNAANDLNGQPTIETMSNGFGEGWLLQLGMSLTANTDYVISFEVSSPSTCTGLAVQLENWNTSTYDFNQQFGASVTSTLQRLSYEFTTTANASNVSINFYAPIGCNSFLNLGRVHLYQGNIGDKSYITTTTTIVP